MKKSKFILSIFSILFFCSSSLAYNTYTLAVTASNGTSSAMYLDTSTDFMPTHDGVPVAALVSYPSSISSGLYGQIVIQENLFIDAQYITYSLPFITSKNPTPHFKENITYDASRGFITTLSCSVDDTSSYWCSCNVSGPTCKFYQN